MNTPGAIVLGMVYDFLYDPVLVFAETNKENA